MVKSLVPTLKEKKQFGMMWVPSILNNPSMSVASHHVAPLGACPFHCGAAIGIVDRVLDSVLSSLSWRVQQQKWGLTVDVC
jgi:hypothetical protein